MQVSYEFNLIMQGEKIEGAFIESWQKYSQGIVEYAQATKTKSKELKHALRGEDCEERIVKVNEYAALHLNPCVS